jgi:hypothetical protein
LEVGGVVLALEVIVGLAVLVGVALVASSDIAGIDDPDADTADLGLPTDRPLRSDDIDRLRFRTVSGLRGAVRGYRFPDVDATMQQVRETLRAHETCAEATAEPRQSAE